ncbi:MAG: glycogen synthase GlgA [Verrucomicrobiae bacterium]|nr:glycogen synthase GlgA [Verrucomicrobiae bacterium]
MSAQRRKRRPAARKKKTPHPLRILFVASECAPYAKVGGLGDVVAALPKALRRLGHDARVILPLYASVDRAKHGIAFERSACVHMGRGEEQWIGLHAATLDGETPVWFVDCARFFGRPGIYDAPWGEYGDNAFRFALFTKAALQICKDTGFLPDVIHAHDWPSALAPAFLKTWDRILSPLSATASVLTIHNIGYQGVSHASAFSYLGVGGEHFASDRFEDHGRINLLKAGIAFADALTTVSPTHAAEILDPVGGCGLAPFLAARRNDLTGILNGVDEEHWDPATDPWIPARYTAATLGGKTVCKRELQKRFGLDPRLEIPVFGIVSRMVHQKGCELMKEAIPQALEGMAMQVVALGTGDRATEDFFRSLPGRFPGRAGVHIGFSNELGHLIEAGSDFFLMPSLYEPCGLSQMYSMKYGTLPLVRATGGLNDTVDNYDEATGAGTGFKFQDPTPGALRDTIGWAVSTWFDRPAHLMAMRARGMALDFSWTHAAREYEKVYRSAIARRREG